VLTLSRAQFESGKLGPVRDVRNAPHAPVGERKLYIRLVVQVNVRLVRTGIAVSNTDYLSGSADLEVDEIVGDRNHTTLRVGDCHCDDADVLAIGIDRRAARRELDGRGLGPREYRRLITRCRARRRL
jgi:hypothetical protein